MSIKYNCYFCETARDMGASWAVCTFNREEDKNYWMKGPPKSVRFDHGWIWRRTARQNKS